MRTPIGRLHDEHVAPACKPRIARFRGQTGAQLEISSVEQRTALPFHERHRAAKNVSRRQQSDLIRLSGTIESALLIKWQNMLHALAAQPRPHQPGSRFGQDDLSMSTGVVGMRVADEAEFRPKLAPVRIQMKRQSGKLNSTG